MNEDFRMWPTEHERESVCTCECCGATIYEGDDYYDILDAIVCEDCMRGARRTAEWR